MKFLLVLRSRTTPMWCGDVNHERNVEYLYCCGSERDHVATMDENAGAGGAERI